MDEKIKNLIVEGANYESTGQVERLHDCLCKAMAMDGRNYELFYMLGNYYYLLQKYNQSFLCYEQAEFYCQNEDIKEIIRAKEGIRTLYDLDVKPVSIIIVSYNTRELMQLCIKSIRATVKPETYEIIVVDNGSNDGICEWLESQTDIKLIVNSENRGFPIACNQGIINAEHDNDIFLLNNDTVLMQNSLFWLRMALYSSINVGTSGSVTNYASNGQKVLIKDMNLDGYLNAASKINVPMNDPYIDKTWLVGFALLIKNQIIKKVGVLDESFSPGNYEDYDYGLKVTNAGFRNLLCKNSFILHWGGQNFKKNSEKLRKLISVNRRKLAMKWNKKTKQILLITHQLSYTGAPLALMRLAIVLQEKGYTIDVISLKDGQLKGEYDKYGITSDVIDIKNEKELEELLGVYDAIVVNTLAGARICELLSGKNEKVFWWIHENELLFEQISDYLKTLNLKFNIKILSAGYYVHSLVKKYMGVDSKILNICVPDKYHRAKSNNNNKIKFAQIGLIDGMKGQEIFIDAIRLLPYGIRDKCEFYICGSLDNANMDIMNIIRCAQQIFPNIRLIDSMVQEKIYEFYDEVDCIVVPSRIESMSTVAIEAFMKEKICICTNTTGISKYIRSGINGYVFPMGDSVALSHLMAYIVKENDHLCGLMKAC